MMIVLYVIALIAVAAALARAHVTFKKYAAIPALSTCIYAGALLYLASMLPGALGTLTAHTVTATMVLLSGLTFALSSAIERVGADSPSHVDASARQPLVSDALVLAAPSLFYYALRHRPWETSSRLLTWDTVSYHLPGFVEYYQKQSLYSLDGPYQTYGFGFELISNFPAYYFQNYWGLYAAHAYSVLFLVVAILAVTRSVVRMANPNGSSRLEYFLAISLFVWIFGSEIFFAVGKNDLFQGACAVGSLAMLLELPWTLDDAFGRRRLALVLGGASVALALGVAAKPTALAYVLLIPWTVALLSRLPRMSLGVNWTARRAALAVVASLFIVSLLGGFFLFRNLVLIGAPVAREVSQWRFSVIANMRNPALYKVQRDSLLFAMAIFTPFIFLRRRASDARARIVRSQVIVFSLVSLGAFVIAPWAVLFSDPADNLRWELRLGLPLFAMMSMAFGLVCGGVLRHIVARVGMPLFRGRLLRLVSRSGDLVARGGMPVQGLVAMLFVVGLLLPAYAQDAEGLPGFDRIRGHQRTTVYEWTQKIQPATRIYAAGLRPYGLYGTQWQHHLFYDLHSAVLTPQSSGISRLMGILRQFRPELILIAIDPEAQSDEKPLVKWVQAQHSCFEEVFEDETVSGFRVLDGCQSTIATYASADMPVHMGL
jgi:hypothetical protein